MAEETVAQPPVVSVAKFNRLITEALNEGPKKVKEIYQIALEKQPDDCPNVPCPHRKKSSKSMEWQHDIQRQLARIARNLDGQWHLKTVAVETSLPVVTAEETPTVTPAPEPAVVAVQEAPVAPVATTAPETPYTGDPFIVTDDGHFMDVEELKKPAEKRFMVPKNFEEFYTWKPEYVINWVKKRLNRFVVDDEVEDWTQDLLIHLRYLPQGSKHRLPGANGRPTGCEDVIETFNPIQQYGASERRFRNYVNSILANKFMTVQSKRQKNPVCRAGNVSVNGDDNPDYDSHTSGEEFIHSNSEFLSSHTMKLAKQHDDRLYTNQFKQFVSDTDPSVYPALEALESTGTIGEAAKFMGVSDGEFTRFRNRLKQLGECFEKGTPVPKQRRPYKKRVKTEETAMSAGTPSSSEAPSA